MRGRRRRSKKDNSGETSRLAAIADAQTAADTAARLARECTSWATSAGVGEDDAAEVVFAALRAREAAEEAGRARTADDAWEWSRQAWAAVSSAQEADARINAAIVDDMMAA